MTKTLEEAIERLKQMPEDRQDSLAQLLLHEIDEDERWRQSTANHTDKLQKLVNEVLEAERRGECEPLDPDNL
jgi:predicted DNA-binding ribbon-helix-helix protein